MYQDRISLVKNIKINSVLFSSIVQIGDFNIGNVKSKVLAVQREIPIFLTNEGNFEVYPLFSRPIPIPVMDGSIRHHVVHQSPFIKVKNIKINGISASSIFQVGSSHWIESEARVKHIRQLISGERPVARKVT